jgi:hypothetical protein
VIVRLVGVWSRFNYNGEIFQNSDIFISSLNNGDWNFDLHIDYGDIHFLYINIEIA